MLNLKLEANKIISNQLILHQGKQRLFKNCLFNLISTGKLK